MARASGALQRTDTSIVGRWWWTVDRWVLGAVMALMLAGVFLSFAGSPPVADRLNLGGFYFVKRHVLLLIPSLFIMFFVSLMTPRQIRRLTVITYFVGLIALVLTAFYGVEIKGAKRWFLIGGFSLQASEFVKPAFAVLAAWMLAEKVRDPNFPGGLLSFLFLCVFVGFLLLQPDLGMAVIVVATWIGLLFVAGIRMVWLGLAGVVGCMSLGGAYVIFPHVQRRLNQFFNPDTGNIHENMYQIHQSLQAFANGGLFGRGPGEGSVKKHLPDAHSDFIFAVAGEEFGLILCLFLLSLFLFIIIRTLLRITHEHSIFGIFATTSLLIQFGLQTLVNMASTLHLIPTKGMTMPFISYGGCSLLALAMGMGMVLALTRKRLGMVEWE